MKKRILALMLACFMIVSLLPAQVFAAGNNQKCPNTHSVNNCEYTEVTTVAPLCEVWGYTVCQCNACGEYFVDVNAEPLGDHVLEAVETKPATCEEPGVMAHQACSVCGWMYVERNGKLVRVVADDLVIPALGHTWYINDGTDCEATVRTCLVCGEEEEVEANHDWADLPVILVDPDEDNLVDGMARYYCNNCEAYKDVVIRHHECVDYMEYVNVPATCTESGWREHYQCTMCGRRYRYVPYSDSYVEVEDKYLIIKPLGHVTSDELVPLVSDPIAVDSHYTYYYAPGSPYFWVVPYNCYFTSVDFIGEDVVGTVTAYTSENYEVYEGMYLEAGSILFFLVEEDGERAFEVSFEVDPIFLKFDTCQDPVHEETFVCDRCGENVTWEIKGGHKWDVMLDVKPTCTEQGVYVAYCTVEGCNEVSVVTTPAKGHNWDKGVKVPGTCQTKGYTLYTCKTCGETKTEEGDFGTHVKPKDHSGYLKFVEATCTEDGKEVYFCELCDAYVAEIIPATGHVRSENGTETNCYGWYYDEETEQWKDGPYTKTYFYCWDCGLYEETYEALELDFDVAYKTLDDAKEGHARTYTVDYSAALEKEGFKDIPNKNDDGIEEHWLEDLGFVREPSCTTIGLKLYQCTCCAEIVLVEVKANGHNYGGMGTTPPTCTEPGYSEGGYCVVCEKFIPFEILPALGHDIDTKKNTYEEVEPTCTEAGSYKGGYCKRCEEWIKFTTITVEEDEEEYEVEIAEVVENEEALIRPALGHAHTIPDYYDEYYYNAETDPGFEYYHYECRREGCDDEFIYWFHRHEWVLDEKASYDADDCSDEDIKNPQTGLEVYYCSCCGMEKNVIVPVHSYGDESCENYGKVCEDCEHVCNVQHWFQFEAHEDASCISGAYDLFVCLNCEHSYAVQLSGPDATKHQWGEPAQIGDTDMAYYGCELCGEVKIDHMPVYVDYTLEIVDEFLYVGKEFAVNVVISGNTADVWGFDLDVWFDDHSVEFVRYESGENFNLHVQDNYVPYAWDEDGNAVEFDTYVSVAGNADGSAVVSEEVVVTLYFKVVGSYSNWMGIAHNMTTDPDMNEINVDAWGTWYDVSLMGDYYQDGKVDLLDVQAVYNYIAGVEDFEYGILGDTDEDGDIDLVDLEAIYKFIVG